ncbi:MAG: hypothetical protein [Caudoviricetes sp.]|nr:MAG: hypothetical protein [Caudoviricetes sp.]
MTIKTINMDLARRKNLSEQEIQLIIKLQLNRKKILGRMQSLSDADKTTRLNIRNEYRQNEKKLQIAWKFSDDSHKRFMTELSFPGCCCPYLDNRDSMFHRYINTNCKWHNL